MITFDAAVRSRLNSEDVASLEKRAAELDELFRTYGKHEFKPRAVYDDALDCIRVLVSDCSACEVRINEWLTVLHDTDPNSDPSPIGFTLKGVRVLVGSTDRVVILTELLDKVMQKDPVEGVFGWITMLKKMTRKEGLEKVELPA